jgi:hypothetical protein
MDAASSHNENVLSKLLAIQADGFPDLDYYDLRKLSENSSDYAVTWLLENPGHIVYSNFCINENDKAINYLYESFNNHTWYTKIFPDALHKNKNPRAKKLIDLYLKGCGFANRKECITYFAEQKNIHLDI